MINDVLFVSENFMRETYFISDNVQSKFILQAVRTAQDTEFQQVVGTTLYEKLKELVKNGTISDNENKAYKDLLSQARYFIGAMAVAELVVTTTIHISNAGANRVKSEDFDVVDEEEMYGLKQYFIKQADHYKRMLQGYCLNNRKSLPELSEYTVNTMASNLQSAASSNLWLGGRRGGNGKPRESLITHIFKFGWY